MINPEVKKQIEESRLSSCKDKLISLGFEITFESECELRFLFNSEIVRFYPYTGWHTGKSIKDGRGFKNLLLQLKRQL